MTTDTLSVHPPIGVARQVLAQIVFGELFGFSSKSLEPANADVTLS
jgi:hypothetical protein